ncbi:hypothetical protein [uncultured Aliiroseovarius sp.]|uniref:hypothetical protein n=1 Tax=uncultured Aliiroseovarius sp. TaxID=1658783 RepID=UPI002610853A|nr:hypothetical protein [uncultured Aliiroseovarius sp.]
MLTRKTALAALAMAGAVWGGSTQIAHAKQYCNVSTAKLSLETDVLCKCEVVTMQMLRYIQRQDEFLNVLADVTQECPAFADALNALPTATTVVPPPSHRDKDGKIPKLVPRPGPGEGPDDGGGDGPGDGDNPDPGDPGDNPDPGEPGDNPDPGEPGDNPDPTGDGDGDGDGDGTDGDGDGTDGDGDGTGDDDDGTDGDGDGTGDGRGGPQGDNGIGNGGGDGVPGKSGKDDDDR